MSENFSTDTISAGKNVKVMCGVHTAALVRNVQEKARKKRNSAHMKGLLLLLSADGSESPFRDNSCRSAPSTIPPLAPRRGRSA
jgi:hypothetical protein